MSAIQAAVAAAEVQADVLELQLPSLVTAEVGVVIAASTLVHFLIFALWRSEGARTVFARSCVASNFHALFVLSYVLGWMVWFGADFSDAERLWVGRLGTGDELMKYCVAVSIGYFVSDLAIMTLHRETRSLGSVVHHLVICPAFLLAMHSRVAHPYHFFFLLEELSTPFLNMKLFWQDDERMKHVFSLLFAAGFFVSRMLFGNYLSATVYFTFPWAREHLLTDNFSFACMVFQVAMCSATRVLNVYWLALIVRKAISSKQAPAPRKGDKHTLALNGRDKAKEQ